MPENMHKYHKPLEMLEVIGQSSIMPNLLNRRILPNELLTYQSFNAAYLVALGAGEELLVEAEFRFRNQEATSLEEISKVPIGIATRLKFRKGYFGGIVDAEYKPIDEQDPRITEAYDRIDNTIEAMVSELGKMPAIRN